MDAVGLAPGAKPVSLNRPLPSITAPPSSDDIIEGNRLLSRVIADSEYAWAVLRQLSDLPSGPVKLEGAAAEFPAAARLEASRKLIMNHVAVLNDITNPMPLTQEVLVRVPRKLALYVDQAMREVCRRLMGRRCGVPEALLLDCLVESKLDPTNPEMVHAWSGMAEYLNERLHSEPEQMPTRTPDMSSEAGKAMRAVLKEVGVGQAFSGGIAPGTLLSNAIEFQTLPPKSGSCCTIM